ncbi:hypothetical protein BCF74_11038 [Knoellia remsis]|uniref:Uncharacterized protein n=1 Tax=Knoellia remsis TaxID=407159 RepID=A0A2T0UMZ6_9MICO|nr:hypothetical protein [Knoellia remsis]PRY59301.1 hypothetical protein BCF74_11038 [Knoellia remsis]
MPTTKPRHAVTETPEVAAALEVAARRWPEDRDRPARLLRHLIEEGRRSVAPSVETRAAARREAARRLSGKYEGMFGPSYLDDLRGEWPE